MSKTFENLTPEEFDAELDAVLDEVRATLQKKRRAYGPGNLAEFGEAGIIVRMGDKWQRIKTHGKRLMGGETVTTLADGESVRDAFTDMIGYCVLRNLHENLARKFQASITAYDGKPVFMVTPDGLRQVWPDDGADERPKAPSFPEGKPMMTGEGE